MKYLKSYWFVFSSLVVLLLLIFIEFFINHSRKNAQTPGSQIKYSLVPDIKDLSDSPQDSLIRYGKELITATSKYLGPHGLVAQITNGLNCGNCHLESGTKLFSNNFLAVASTYPKFRERSGRIESIEFRINECLQRSLDGSAIDSLSREMRAIKAYVKWTGKNLTQPLKNAEIKSKEISFMQVAAEPAKGAVIYQAKCKLCHGDKGQGLLLKDSSMYLYPPLWGKNTYAVSAGMYRITKLASFIKYNMPLGATFKTPQLTDEEAWHLAAYINTQPHPDKMFAYDWPVIGSKPVDYPFGPYDDKFSEKQHKYGPFLEILKSRHKL